MPYFPSQINYMAQIAKAADSSANLITYITNNLLMCTANFMNLHTHPTNAPLLLKPWIGRHTAKEKKFTRRKGLV